MLWNHPSATHVRNIKKKTLSNKDGVTNLFEIWQQVRSWGKSVTGDTGFIRSMPRISSMEDLQRVCTELFQAIDEYRGEKLQEAKQAVPELEKHLQRMIDNTRGSLWTARPRDVDLREWQPGCQNCQCDTADEMLTCERCLASWHATTQCTALDQADINDVFSWEKPPSASSATAASSAFSTTDRVGCSTTGNSNQRKWWCPACAQMEKSAFQTAGADSPTPAAAHANHPNDKGVSNRKRRRSVENDAVIYHRPRGRPRKDKVCNANTGEYMDKSAFQNQVGDVVCSASAASTANAATTTRQVLAEQPVFEVGTLVEAYHARTKKFYDATVVTYDSKNRLYKVDWADGDKTDRNVPAGPIGSRSNDLPGVQQHITTVVQNCMKERQKTLSEVAQAAGVDSAELQAWLARSPRLRGDRQGVLDIKLQQWTDGATPAAAHANHPNGRGVGNHKRQRSIENDAVQPVIYPRPRGRPRKDKVWNANTGKYD